MPHLALLGGTPVRTKSFPKWPILRPAQAAALHKAWEGGVWGIRSPQVAEFEKRFAEFQHAKYALAMCNGTASLWVALKACGVKAGDEVIIPPYTFIATASAVLMANAVPVFVDIDPNTYNLDPTLLEAAITTRTKAIMPVHIAGQPADLDAILAIARKYRLAVIEDAAQAHGAEWQGRRVGALGDVGSFSFQSSKNMSAGEGGALVSDSKELMDRCFSYYNCGRVREGAWYDHRVLGSNMRMTAWSAAVLTAQFATIAEDMELRDHNAGYLDQRLCEIPGIQPLVIHPQVTRHARHLYIFRYDAEAFEHLPREKFLAALQAEGIPAYKGYTPLYREPMFGLDPREYPWLEGCNYHDLRLPVCEHACEEEAVWLAQSVLLGSAADMEDIVRAVAKIHQNVGELVEPSHGGALSETAVSAE
ncbi:aminotransferase DegT [candidate division KSB1 bacterium]|nr:DegT/DnrJ/EryC1/StrS family aminotransferase [candidate division KSB1 bacterium]RIK73317.1 MAG: aminotransferase DegT [candidate division KSB1 bacterium]